MSQRVLCYGDSNTAGFCNGGQRFHPYKMALEQALRQQGLPIEVAHCGLSGLTAEELMHKVTAKAIRDVCGKMGKGLERLLDEKPTNLVVIMLGTNDIGAGTRPQQTLSYVSALHAACHERGIPTVALAPPTVLGGQPRNDRNRFAQMLSHYERATPDALMFADCEELVPRTPALWEPDQLHLSPAGSDQLGKKLAPMVAKIVAGLAGSRRRNFKVGQRVEYLNEGTNQWVPTRITLAKRNGAVIVEAEPGALIPVEVQARKIRIPGSYSVGQDVEFYSVSSKQWVPCKVTHVEPSGSVQVEVKPGTWISLEEQAQRMRVPAAAPTQSPPQSKGPMDRRASDPSLSGDPAPDMLALGQQVEYFSASQNRWVPSRVTHMESGGGVQVDVKPGTWIFKEDQPGKIRVPQSGAYAVGDQLEYLSASQRRWVQCRVAVVEPSGAIQLDVKLGYSICREEQAEKLRLPQSGESGFSIGQTVEYHSKSCDRWITCHVTAVAPNGDLSIDAKPGYAMSLVEQAERIRVPVVTSLVPQQQRFNVGQEVDVWDDHKQNWVKDKIEKVDETGGVMLGSISNISWQRQQQEENIRLPRDKFQYYT